MCSAVERRKKIIEYIETNAKGKISEIAAICRVSEATVRRDIKDLSSKGLLLKVHGGAVASRGPSPELSLLKEIPNLDIKKRIALKARDYINNNETIILDAGSTTYELAKLLKDKMNLTVVTNSLEIAYTLAPSKGVTVNLTGGTADKAFYALYGPLACATIDKIFVDKVVLGTSGLDIFKGITDPNLPVAQMKQAMINVAKEVIIVTDSSKIGKVYFAAVAPLSVVRMIITDSDASENSVRYLREEGIEVVIC
jgi:DeoR family fructose operon transcriptional repressor